MVIELNETGKLSQEKREICANLMARFVNRFALVKPSKLFFTVNEDSICLKYPRHNESRTAEEAYKFEDKWIYQSTPFNWS